MAKPNQKKPAESLQLLNRRTMAKEELPYRDPVRLYLPLPPGLRPDKSGPALEVTQFSDLAKLRIYCVAELLLNLLNQEKRSVRVVENLAEGDVAIADSETAPGKKGLWLEIAAPFASGQLEPYSLDEARYLMHSATHSGPVQWSDGALEGARAALGRLKEYLTRLESEAQGQKALDSGLKVWRQRFYFQLYDDLNTPRALAILWTMLQSDLTAATKYGLLSEFCQVLGVISPNVPKIAEVGPPPVYTRPNKKPAVQPVSGLESGLPLPEPKPKAPSAPKPTRPVRQETVVRVEAERRRIQASREVRSYLAEPDQFDFTVSLVAYDSLTALRTTVESLLYYIPRSPRSVQVIAVETNSAEGIADYLDGIAARYANFRVVYTRQNLGEAAGRNVAFRQARGRWLVLLDAGLKLTGDLFQELYERLKTEDETALYGAYPLELLRQGPELQGFAPASLLLKQGQAPANSIELEAVEGSFLCFRRNLIDTVGFMDEHFRLPYALDLDYSFAFKDKGYKVKALTNLERVLERPASFSRPDFGLPADQYERQRQKNWQLFLRSWEV